MLNAKQRGEAYEVAATVRDLGNDLADTLDSWDEADREEREGLAELIETALTDIADQGETAARLVREL